MANKTSESLINAHYRYIRYNINLCTFSLTFSIKFNFMRIIMNIEKLLNNMKFRYLDL